jgi:hypothetical protein
MMKDESQELVIHEKTYISTRKASEMSGYTSDYVGQIARAGIIPTTLIGATRFVEKKAFAKYVYEQKGKELKETRGTNPQTVPSVASGDPTIAKIENQKTEKGMHYETDNRPLQPELKKKEASSQTSTKGSTTIPLPTLRQSFALVLGALLLIGGTVFADTTSLVDFTQTLQTKAEKSAQQVASFFQNNVRNITARYEEGQRVISNATASVLGVPNASFSGNDAPKKEIHEQVQTKTNTPTTVANILGALRSGIQDGITKPAHFISRGMSDLSGRLVSVPFQVGGIYISFAESTRETLVRSSQKFGGDLATTVTAFRTQTQTSTATPIAGLTTWNNTTEERTRIQNKTADGGRSFDDAVLEGVQKIVDAFNALGTSVLETGFTLKRVVRIPHTIDNPIAGVSDALFGTFNDTAFSFYTKIHNFFSPQDTVFVDSTETDTPPQTTPPKTPPTQIVREIVVERPITRIERVVERVTTPTPTTLAVAGVTEAQLQSALDGLNNALRSEIYKIYDGESQSNTVRTIYQTIAQTNNIDQLNGVTINNATVNSLSGLTDSDIPDGITVSGYVPLGGGSLTGAIDVPYINATSTTATSTFAGGLNVGSGSFIYDFSTGNIGVGTTSPFKKFSVLGDAYVKGDFTVNGNSSITEGGALTVGDKVISEGEIGVGTSTPYSKLGIQNTITTQTAVAIYGTTGQSAPLFDIYDNSTSNTNLFRITADGNVGIGTTSPANQLSFSGLFYAGGTGTSTITDNLTVGGDFNFSGSLFQNNQAFVGSQWTTSGSDIYYNTGNIGIGTTSPYAKLSVVGPVVAEYFYATSTSATTTFAGGLNVAGASGLNVLQNGKVGIGTGNPFNLSALHIRNGSAGTYPGVSTAGDDVIIESGGDGGLSIFTPTTNFGVLYFSDTNDANAGGLLYNHADDSLAVRVADATRLHITSSGRIGISDTTPDAQLDVQSSIATTIGLIVQGATSQSANLQEWQDSSGGILSLIDSGGDFIHTSATKSGNYLEAGRTSGGGKIVINDFGTLVADNVPTNTDAWLAFGMTGSALTYSSLGFGFDNGAIPWLGFGPGNATRDSFIRRTSGGGLILSTTIDAATSFTIKGGATQTGNLQEWQNSAGGILGVFSAGGSMGIGTSTPWRTFSVTGTVGLSSTLTSGSTGNYLCINTSTYEVTLGTTCSASSERFKENINTLSYGLDAINQLNPVSFNYKKEFNPDTSVRIGFIAEDVAQVIPELVVYGKDGQTEAVVYENLTAVLAGGIQELDAKVEALRALEDETFFDVLLTRFAQAMLRVKHLVVDDELCIGATCVTEAQLQNLLAGNAAGSSLSTNTDTSTDITPPIITINGNNPAEVALDSTYADLGAYALDAVDGERFVDTEGTVDTTTAGTYIITYSSYDTSGNTATTTRTVNVVDGSSSAPIDTGTTTPETLPDTTPTTTPETLPEITTPETQTDTGTTTATTTSGV